MRSPPRMGPTDALPSTKRSEVHHRCQVRPMRSEGVRYGSLAATLLVGAIALGAWEAAVRLSGISPFLLPAPSAIAVRFGEAWSDGTMLRHLVPTMQEMVIGGAIGGAAGLIIGIALGVSRAARSVASPYLVAAQSTPLLALGPLFVIWFGPGAAAKIAICAIISLFPLAISTLVAVRDADPGILELYRSLGASRLQLLIGARLPAARAGIFAGARVAATLEIGRAHV
mgnify:CR=1 FL=1